jgi:hypothetical protein
MRLLWILIASPLVGYLVADWGRRAFSDDPALLPRLLRAQPVTMGTGLVIIGALVGWILSEVLTQVFSR